MINYFLVDILEKQENEIKRDTKYINYLLKEIEENGGEILRLESRDYNTKLFVVYIDKYGKRNQDIILEKLIYMPNERTEYIKIK